MKAILLAAGALAAGSAILPAPVKATDLAIGVVIGDRYRDDRHGYGRYGSYAYQAGYERGRHEGFKQGDKDDDRDRGYGYWDEKTYRRGSKGYKSHYGPFAAYQAGFRRGYARGYNEGYGNVRADRDYDRPRWGYRKY